MFFWTLICSFDNLIETIPPKRRKVTISVFEDNNENFFSKQYCCSKCSSGHVTAKLLDQKLVNSIDHYSPDHWILALFGIFGIKAKNWIGNFWDKIQNIITDMNIPGWSPRDNQSWTALFQRIDVFQRWFRKHAKYKRWSALFQTWLGLIFSESPLFRIEKFRTLNTVLSEKISSESALFKIDFLCSETLNFQHWTALIQRWCTVK